MSTESSATKPLWPLEGHGASLKLPAADTGGCWSLFTLQSFFFFSCLTWFSCGWHWRGAGGRWLCFSGFFNPKLRDWMFSSSSICSALWTADCVLAVLTDKWAWERCCCFYLLLSLCRFCFSVLFLFAYMQSILSANIFIHINTHIYSILFVFVEDLYCEMSKVIIGIRAVLIKSW